MSSALVMVSVVLWAAWLPGCTQALGVEPLSRAVPFDYAEPACGSCVAESCQAEENDCRADEGCRALFDCLVGCSVDDGECRGRCEERVPYLLTSPSVEALESCRRASCLEPCIGTRLGVASAYGSECDSCLETQCAAIAGECLSSAACERTLRCSAGCTDPDCVVACAYAFGSWSASLGAAYKGCVVSCPAVCPHGQNWGCVGNYAWGKAESTYATISLRYTALDSLQRPAPNLTMQACHDLPPPCVPMDTVVTGDDGVAVLSLTVGLKGFTGFIAASGQIAGNEILPSLGWLDRPFLRSEVDFVNTHYTRLEFEQFAAAYGVPIVDGRGHLAATAFDCSALWAPGVQFEFVTSDPAADPPPYIHYFGGSVTDDGGSAWVANVPPGEVQITALYEGEPVAHFTAHVMAGMASGAGLFPDPIQAAD